MLNDSLVQESLAHLKKQIAGVKYLLKMEGHDSTEEVLELREKLKSMEREVLDILSMIRLIREEERRLSEVDEALNRDETRSLKNEPA